MNVITHAQFCSDPVVSNDCVAESCSCVARVDCRLFVDGGCGRTPLYWRPKVESMLCALLLFLFVVLQLAPGAVETLLTDRGASESFSITQQNSERLRLIVEQQRTAETDCVVAKTSATDKAAQKLRAEMAATLGRIEEFDGDKEEWSQYQEQLEYFFQANRIEDADKKRAVFLLLIGANMYKQL